MRLIAIITLVILFGCNPTKRLNRLVKQHPELTRIDTVTVKDTTIIPEVKTDTLFKHKASPDTVYIEKEKLKIKYVNDGKTVFIEGKCEGDTIYKDILVPVERIINVEASPIRYQITLLILLILGFLYFVWRLRK